jgi:lipopolysaccharide/colanic/teichoic acid biosynthesis glycosyltransferase
MLDSSSTTGARRESGSGVAESELAEVVRRLWDIVASLLVLGLGWPIWVLIALLIKLDSPGPALYVSQRIGKNRKPFTFYKFRTMYVNAGDILPEQHAFEFDLNDLDSVYLQLEKDPRVTRIGRFLRTTSLDEVPNFINILLGQMTLVGPRPEAPEMLKYYSRHLKFQVKPGLTCLAQTSGRGQLNFPDTVRLDEEYVMTRSLWLDLKILLKTVWVVVTRHGAY